MECYLSPDQPLWAVYDEPCRVNGERRNLTTVEREEVIPAIKQYLGRVWWLGLFPKSYALQFLSGARKDLFGDSHGKRHPV